MSRQSTSWRKVAGLGFGLCAALLFPWMVILTQTLPANHQAAHWAFAWIGLDAAMALLMAAVATAAWRRSDWLQIAATACGTLLVLDAWFDLLTAASRTELVQASIEAVFGELPAAAACLLLVMRARRWRAAR